jgi:hypothetical protein
MAGVASADAAGQPGSRKGTTGSECVGEAAQSRTKNDADARTGRSRGRRAEQVGRCEYDGMLVGARRAEDKKRGIKETPTCRASLRLDDLSAERLAPSEQDLLSRRCHANALIHRFGPSPRIYPHSQNRLWITGLRAKKNPAACRDGVLFVE